MKIQTKDLEGEALNWAVAFIIATAENQLSALRVIGGKPRLLVDGGNPRGLVRSTNFSDWAQAGPIMFSETIGTRGPSVKGGAWAAFIDASGVGQGPQFRHTGPTPQIAGMRSFVASRLGSEVEVPDELVPHLSAQRVAERSAATQPHSGAIPAPKRADPDITNKWCHVNTFENYVDFDKELYSLPDEGNTSVDMRMSFDTEDHTCHYTIKLHNDDCETRDWEKEHRIPWSVGIAMLVADGVEVPAVLMAQSAQEGPGGANDSATAHQPIDRPRG